MQGLRVVVTGGGQGIGAACCRDAAKRGAAVVVNDINRVAAEAVADEIKADGGVAIADGSDISDWVQAQELIETCLNSFGGIDGLVNNAAIIRLGLMDEVDQADVETMLRVNIGGTVACTHFAIGRMREQGHGSIVNMTSGAQTGHHPQSGVYGSTKGAIASLTYAWNAENVGTGIRVNAVAPMATDTGMLADLKTYLQPRDEQLMPDIARSTKQCAAVSYCIAPLVSFLLSDHSLDVSGQVVRFNGNALSLMSRPAVMPPVLERNNWSFETIAKALTKDLASNRISSGLLQLETETRFVPYHSAQGPNR